MTASRFDRDEGNPPEAIDGIDYAALDALNTAYLSLESRLAQRFRVAGSVKFKVNTSEWELAWTKVHGDFRLVCNKLPREKLHAAQQNLPLSSAPMHVRIAAAEYIATLVETLRTLQLLVGRDARAATDTVYKTIDQLAKLGEEGDS